MGEWLRWCVALTCYPFLLASDLIHHGEEERFIAEQRAWFLKQHEGE